MKPVRRRSPGSLAISIAIHVVVVFALVQIVFRYPLGQLTGFREADTRPEELHYVNIPPASTEHSGGGGAPKAQPAAPAALRSPLATPSSVPTTVDSSRASAAGGTGTGVGVGGAGLATGVVPRAPDPRIALMPGPILRVPRTTAEDVDSIVSVVIGIYNDSMAVAQGRRQPGDWTIKGANGSEWGWDQRGIHLGKFTIPQALLALLPLNVSSPMSPIDARTSSYIRRDVLENAQRNISEDEFRAAVKRIRERKERERREKMLADQAKGPGSQ